MPTVAIPEPSRLPLLGHAAHVSMETPVQDMMRLGRELGPIFRFKLPVQELLVVSSPELVAELSDEDRFEKDVHPLLIRLRGLAGHALFTADTADPRWETAHRVLMPAFGPGALHETFPLMLDIATQLVEKWERLGPDVAHDVPDATVEATP